MKKLICTLALAAMLCGAVTAASGSYTVSARLRPDVTVVIDGVERTFFNVQGQEVHPISYAGTTYVPIRSIGELMDKNVNWDGATSTATIGGARVTADATGTPDVNARAQDITLTMEPNYTIVIDGVERTFYDVNGKVCDPALYNGSIYLPIRAIGEIMGKTVSWDGVTDTVTLSGGTSTGGVTDFDTANPGGTTGNTGTTGSITLERAKEIALSDAGVSASQATFVRAHLDYDDGRQVYDVEFVVASGSGYLEYDYEIDTATGRIVGKDRDAEFYRPGTTPSGGTQTGAAVSLETAKTTALNHAGVSASQATFVRANLDYDDGRQVYDVEFVVASGSGYLEYDYEIDASTGAILSVDQDAEFYRPTTPSTGGTTTISREQAQQTALSRVSGATASNVYELHLEWDDGRQYYEGKIYYGTMEYDFTIDAVTGAVVEWEAESIYD